jgi:hypothetical protein
MSYQQYPGAGGYPAQYPGAQPQPSGGTAITAGVLAVLGGLWHLVSLVGSIVIMTGAGAVPFVIISAVLSAAISGCLITGGILLFLKKPAGRLSTIIGSGLAILMYVASAVFVLAAPRSAGVAVGGGVAVLVFSAPAIATLVLAIVKPTARWVGKVEPVAPLTPPGYPPQQYPGQQYSQPGQQYPPSPPYGQQYPPPPPQGQQYPPQNW